MLSGMLMPLLVPPNTNGSICAGAEFVADCEMLPSRDADDLAEEVRSSSPVSGLQKRTRPRLSAPASRSAVLGPVVAGQARVEPLLATWGSSRRSSAIHCASPNSRPWPP